MGGGIGKRADAEEKCRVTTQGTGFLYNIESMVLLMRRKSRFFVEKSTKWFGGGGWLGWWGGFVDTKLRVEGGV